MKTHGTTLYAKEIKRRARRSVRVSLLRIGDGTRCVRSIPSEIQVNLESTSSTYRRGVHFVLDMDVRREERWAGGGGHGREHASTSTYRHGDRHGRGGGGRGSRRDVRSHGRFQPARGSSSRWSKPSSHVVVNWTRQERQALYLAANCRFGLRLGAAGDGAGGPGSPGSGAGPGAGSGSGGRFSLGFDWDDDVVFLEIDVVRDKETENWGRDEENSRVTSSALLCPISLDTLELPFMTPCGHVFSLVSLVTDMVVREGSWESLGSLRSGGPRCRLSGPCPMCGVEVAARELKPVRVRVVERVERNGVGRWRLMRRRGGEGDGEACAVGGENESESENKKANKKANKKTNSTDSSNRGIRQFGVMHVDALEGVFGSRMYVENPEVLYRYVVCRLAARSEEVAEEGGAESGCRYLGYLTAIDVVVEMAKRMMGEEEGGQVGRRLREDVGGVIAWCRGEVARVRRQARLDEEFPSLDGSGSAGKESMVDIERLTVRCRSGTSGKDVVKTEGPGKRVSETPETSYFYQSADGQRVFLNALNTEMLCEAGCVPRVVCCVDVSRSRSRSRSRSHHSRSRARHRSYAPGILPSSLPKSWTSRCSSRRWRRKQRRR